ncbi:MAG: class I SAM-dependent methyltransferase [Polyangiales bacterium]
MSTIEDVKANIRSLNPENKFFAETELTDQQQHFEREKPQPYLQRTCELFAAIGGRTIVEIGCMRAMLKHPIEEIHPVCCNDGHSTYVWCTTGADVTSVDISRRAVRRARKSCRKFDNCRIIHADGLKFLETYTGTIDLLYLDAWNVHAHIPYAESHLIAYLKAKDKLSERNIIAVDDTDIASGGKGKYLIPYLQYEGYEILVQGRQTIAFRETR